MLPDIALIHQYATEAATLRLERIAALKKEAALPEIIAKAQKSRMTCEFPVKKADIEYAKSLLKRPDWKEKGASFSTLTHTGLLTEHEYAALWQIVASIEGGQGLLGSAGSGASIISIGIPTEHPTKTNIYIATDTLGKVRQELIGITP